MTSPRPFTLGVLTSGGDCAGLNAAVAAVALAALARGWKVVAIEDGSDGLIDHPRRGSVLTPDSAHAIDFRRGGSALGSVNGGNPFQVPAADGSTRDRTDDFVAGVRELGLDALIAVGGDGSIQILDRLCRAAGLPLVGIPKTIDNDVPGTDVAIGFASAVGVVSGALDQLQPTAASHRRILVVEVMGRTAGHLALHGGLAGGADVILIPELGFDVSAVAAHLRAVVQRRRHALMVVAEGVRLPSPASGSVGGALARQFESLTAVKTRCTVLGYLQRGGPPCAQDRLLARALGVHAVAMVADGRCDRLAAWRRGALAEVPLAEVVTGPRLVAADDPLLETARRLGVGLGH